MDSTEYAAAVAANIQSAIKRAGKPVATLAAETGIPRSTLDRRLRSHGLSPFTVREVKAIALALSTPAEPVTAADLTCVTVGTATAVA